MTMTQTSAGSISRAPRPSSLADVLDLILDKGLVIDAYVRISVAGIEVLTVDARVVVASVDTYLRFAEAVNRLDLTQTEQAGIKALTGSGSDEQDNSSNGSRNGQAGSQSGRGSPGREDSERRRPLGRGESSQSRNRKDDASSKQQRDDEQGDEQGDEGDDDDSQGGLLGRIAERARFDR